MDRAEQIIAIAQHEGWKWYRCRYIGQSAHAESLIMRFLPSSREFSRDWMCDLSEDQTSHFRSVMGGIPSGVPHYTDNIEYALSVVRKLTGNRKVHFIRHLHDILYPAGACYAGNRPSPQNSDEFGIFSYLMATPEELCEAFLKTVGRWVVD